MKSRTAVVSRETTETKIELEMTLEGTGQSCCRTGVGFLDHMLDLLAHHAAFDLTVDARGDLETDDHHLVEDVGIVLGQALAEALGQKRGIERFGSMLLPMDDVLVAVAVDLSGRFAFATDYRPVRERVGDLSTEMVPHFFRSLASSAGLNLHIRILDDGNNEHHRIEAMFKGLGRVLRQAVRIQDASGAVPSTKGTLDSNLV